MSGSKKSNAYLIVLVLIAAGLCIGWTDSWDSIRKAAGSLSSVEAGFVQTKHMKILARPLVSKGVFCFKPPASLRWEYRHPFHSILLMHNGTVKRYRVTDGKTYEDAGIQLHAMQFVLEEIAHWLSGRFNENPAFDTVLTNDRRIILSPKAAAMAKIIQKIELRLSEQPGIIKSVSIFEDEESYTLLEFNNVTLNRQLEDTLFLKMP